LALSLTLWQGLAITDEPTVVSPPLSVTVVSAIAIHAVVSVAWATGLPRFGIPAVVRLWLSVLATNAFRVCY
jgi:hypothetical protein